MAGMMTKVTFASKISILMKTTSDDPNPTAGYLYGEVSKISYESVEYCEHMLEFLLVRLRKNSLNVKLKALLVMRNVIEKGSVEFTRSLRKQSTEIKEMKSFSGPPDPLLGDSVYVQIRKTASEILEILFDTDRLTPASSSISNIGNVSAPPSMEGFGVSTPGAQDSGILKSIIGKIKETVPHIKNATAYMIPTQTSNNNNNNFNDINKTNPDYQCFEKPNSILPSSTIFGRFGSASHVEGDSKTDAINSYGTNQQNTPPSWLVKKSNDTSVSIPQKYQIDLHENEKRIVEELVTPQGIRSQPTTQDMYQFLQKCETLDCEVIVKLLCEKLSHQDTRVQLRTMFILESLLQSNLSDICKLVRDNCESLLKTFLTSSHVATRDKAEKVLQLMKNDEVEVAPVVFNNYHNQPTTLLDASPRQQQQQQHGDIFGDLQIHEKSKAQVKPLDVFKTTNTGNASNLFDTQSFDNIRNKQSDLMGLGLDPFSSLTQMGTTTHDSGGTSAMNAGVLWPNSKTNMEQNKTSVPVMNTTIPKMGDAQTHSTKKSEPFITSSTKELDDFYNIENKGENKCETNNFIADFSNISENDGFRSKQGSTFSETPTNSNLENIKKNKQYDVPSSTISLFEGLQMNPNMSSSSTNQFSSSSKSTIPVAKDKNMFFQTNSNPFDLLSPELRNLSTNASLPKKNLPVNQFQRPPEQCNFTGYSNNSIGTMQSQNMTPVNFRRPPIQMNNNPPIQMNNNPPIQMNNNPPIQMNNNPHNFAPQTFHPQNPQSNTSQFQTSLGPSPMRYHQPIGMQSYPHVNSSNNSFNFLSQKSSAGKGSNDSFNFVQDAMKASIKK